MNRVCIYLRKSRADEELERDMGKGETLSRHRAALLKYAADKQLKVLRIHEELVSGESIIHRPEMLELLKEVQQGLYDAVLVMDLQRLGRGDMEEQGLILKTFKNTHTRIITPDKTYDLSNEFDEEYSEFEAFMSRKEFKMINKRLQRGVLRSVEEGNYLSPQPPFGYTVKSEKHARTLLPHPEQASVVKLIFDWYVRENRGCTIIAGELNRLGIKTAKGNSWTHNSIAYVIKNPVYIGKITWKKVKTIKSTEAGKVKRIKANRSDEWMVCDGKHEPLIDESTFLRAQEILQKQQRPPAKLKAGLTNPLAGIVYCKVCGAKMVFRPYSNASPYLICREKCGNKGSKFEQIEKKILEVLKFWLQNYDKELTYSPSTVPDQTYRIFKHNIDALEKELKDLVEQKKRQYDFLEQGIYSIEIFTERSNAIEEKIKAVSQAVTSTKNNLELELRKLKEHRGVIPIIRNAIDLYPYLSDAKEKNLLLKSILDKAEYYKERNQTEEQFDIYLYPRVQHV